jgi:hypothetical protein
MSAARVQEQVAVFAYVGQVSISDNDLTVTSGAVSRPAQRTPGCLTELLDGDRVLFVDYDRRRYVLQVLERQSSGVKLISDGDFSIGAPHGQFTVAAQEGIRLLTAGTAAVSSTDLRLLADTAAMTCNHLRVTARKTVQSVAGRVASHCQGLLQVVEGVLATQAGSLSMRAQKLVTVHGRTAVVTGEDVVKVDAKQVIVG